MSRVQQTAAAILLTLNLALTIFLTWHQITVAQAGRKYGIEDDPPFIFLLLIASLVIASGTAFRSRRYRSAIIGGTVLALFLMFSSAVALGGGGM
jgi:hypothetical protein